MNRAELLLSSKAYAYEFGQFPSSNVAGGMNINTFIDTVKRHTEEAVKLNVRVWTCFRRIEAPGATVGGICYLRKIWV